MNRHQLATVLAWAGEQGVSGRKRLQKVIFFLQKAGCSLDCHYTLHFYGPYSRDVAETCDEMVAAGLLHEAGETQNGMVQYKYTLAPPIRALVSQSPDPQVQQFEAFGKELLQQSIWSLELGATILFFYGQAKNWDHAMEQACEFKQVLCEGEANRDALKLAQSFSQHSAA